MTAARLVDRVTRGATVLLIILSLATAVGARQASAAIDLGQKAVRFDIPPQQLPSALLKFSEQSGVQVTSAGQLLEGKESPGVVGTFPPSKALALLLKDTALVFDVVDGNTVVITALASTAVQRRELQRISSSFADPAGAATESPRITLAQAAPGTAPPAAATAAAEAPAPTPGEGKLEEVVVTGSMIKRINAETALPVQVLKREDLARSGATNVEELFKQISAANSFGSTVQAQATGNLTGAISTISLRGLGSGRTLVLINGRRAAVYGGGSLGANGN